MNMIELIKKLRLTADNLEDIFDPNPNKEKEKAFKVALSDPGYFGEAGLGKTIQALNMVKTPRVSKTKFIRKYTRNGKHWTQTAKGKKILSAKMKAAWKLRNKEKAK